MASNKSLELAAIKAAAPKRMCICGAEFDSHMRKDGRGRLARFNNDNHMPAGQATPTPRGQLNRAQRRALRRNR